MEHEIIIDELLRAFIDYHEYEVQKLDITKIPLALWNVWHEHNLNSQQLYSGSINYRPANEVTDWTTDMETALTFSTDRGFLVSISREAFAHRFNFVSMDVIYDFLSQHTTDDAHIKELKSYVSESEIVLLSVLPTM